MTGRDIGLGAAALVAALAIAGADIAWVPGLIQAGVLPLLGERAGDYPLVETLFAAIVFGILILAALVGGAVARRNVLAPGERAPTMAAIGFAVGVGGVSAAVGYAALAGTLTAGGGASTGAGLLLFGTLAVAIQVAGEEIFFRGWLQPVLVDRWGAVAGLVATALAFAAIHVFGGARASLSLVNLSLGGLVFGMFALHGRGLAGAAAMHFGWNATEQLGWGLDPNPGVGSFGAIADRDLAGAALWGGSAEGLNASLGMTFALVAILVPLALALRRAPRAAPALSRSPS